MKNVDFLFEYEVRNRELDSICLLGAYLETKGYRVGYVNSWDNLYHFQRSYRTKVIVISAAYNNETYNFFTSHADSFQKVVNMQWEQVLVNRIVYSEDPSSWDYSGTALSTRHVCWGEENRKYLNSRYSIPESYLRVCGYIPLDFYRKEFLEIAPKREELFEKYNLDPQRRTILFVSSFSGIGLPKSEEAIGNDYKKKLEKQIQTDSQRKIINWFDAFLETHSDYQIVYRPHPSEADNSILLKKTQTVRGFHVIAQESIRNWIQCCDILCNWQSTSMIEMFISGKKTLLLRPISIPFENEMPIFIKGKYISITNYDDFESAILDNRKNYPFPIEKDDLLRFYDIDNKPTYQRIGEYLIESLNDNNYNSPNRNKKSSFLRKVYRHTKMKIFTAAASVAYKIFCRNETSENGTKMISSLKARINEQYVHYNYFKQKMKLNRVSQKELRKKIECYKKIITGLEK